MILKEEQRDLFSLPHGYWFAHCISADFALGAGIAKQFEEMYGMRHMLRVHYGDENGFWDFDSWGASCLPCSNVLNLVTKKKCFHKPTLIDLEEALRDMVHVCREHGIKKVAMPRIGCGLDRLNWDDVRPLIEDVFEDEDIEILVCVL